MSSSFILRRPRLLKLNIIVIVLITVGVTITAHWALAAKAQNQLRSRLNDWVPRIQKGFQEAVHYVNLATPAQAWSGLDIGGPGAIGSGLPNGSLVTLQGAGTGINTGGSEQGYFVSTLRTGDVEMVVKVLQVTGGAKTQVGIMLRESTNASADMACALYEVPASGNPVLRQAYRRPGYHTNNATTPPLSIPVWLKLQRVGQTYATFRSTDGLIWVPITNYSGGGFTPANFLAGFFISGGGAAATADAQLEIVYLGAPRLEYRTTWVGNTFSNDVDRYVSQSISALFVGADGRCYTNSTYDEAGEAAKIYQDGKVIGAISNGGGNTCIGSHCVYSGSITGDGQYVYLLKRPVTEAGTGKVLDQVIRTDLNGQNPTAVTLTSKPEIIGGMAAGNGEIYFSDVNNNQILVASATTLTELPVRKFAFIRPGPMTVDWRGNLWIIQRATDHPIGPTVQYAASIRCYQPNGTFTGKEITDVVNPTAVAIDPTQDRLLVAEGGPAQNIRFYNLSGATPAFTGTFGITGGLFNPPNPGRINDEANGGYQRLSFPNGLGMDTHGNLYVSCGGIGSDLRKYDVNGNLVWQLNGLVYVSVPDFDPATDGNDLHWFGAHVAMDYSKTAPGSEWRYAGLSRNLFAPSGQEAPTGANTIIRRLGPNKERIMFTIGVPPFNINIYRFNGELAVPCGAYGFKIVNGQQVERLWVDLNGDGIETAEERYIPADVDELSQWSALDVDDQGNLLIKQASHNFYPILAGTKKIRRIQFQGQSAQGVPLYKLAKDGFTDIQVPFEIAYPFHFRYIEADDAMYFVGFTYDQKHVLARYDHWSAPTRTLRYLRQLPTPRDSTNFLSFPPYVGTPDFQKLASTDPDAEFHYFALDVAGDKVFIGELWGPIHVYDAKLGNPVTRFDPGPEVSGVAGWTDIRQGVRAFKRSNGEYVVTREDAGIRARNLLFRWTPATLDRAPQTPTELSAIGGANTIQLRWRGELSLTRKYEVWRGTSSGSETLYADNVTAPLFDDTGVTPGVTYYYKVRAVNEVGASNLSNEAQTLANAAAKFVRMDALTEGNWKGVYGSEGYLIVGDTQSFPNSIQLQAYGYDPNRRVINPGNSPYFPPFVRNNGTTTNPEFLEKAGSTERIDAFWTSKNVTMNWHFTDGLMHRLAIYLNASSGVAAYSQVELFDSFGNLLDRRIINSLQDAKYAVWAVTGRVRVVISEVSPTTPDLSIRGVFVDAAPTMADACGMTNTPPVVTVQPQEVNACLNQPVTYTVQAAGQNLTYQWRKDKVPIPGATTNTLSFPSVKLTDRGTYDVLVTGACGTDISLGAFLPIPFKLVMNPQPTSQTVNAGGSVTFTATAVPDSFVTAAPQWQVSRDQGGSWVNIPGGITTFAGASTTSSLTLSPILPGQNGERYRVVFTNYCTSVTSDPATLTVTGFACPTRFTVNDLGDAPDALAGDGTCADANGKCTLRAAMEESNALANYPCNPLTIDFSVTGTIRLLTALPAITHANLTITGPNARDLMVQRSTDDGTPNFRIFTINSAKTVSISGLTLSNGNVIGASAGGGGAYTAGQLTLTNCALLGNHADYAGGAAYVTGSGVLNLIGCTLAGNSAAEGGAIGVGFAVSATINLTNSTVSGNTAQTGGGLYLDDAAAQMQITSSTIAFNSAANAGGGVTRSAGTFRLFSTLIAANTAPTSPDAEGVFTSQGYNLIGKTNGSSGWLASDKVGTLAVPLDAKLGTLANNGGATDTHALLLNSPAIDQGKSTGLTTDQRGQLRVVDATNLPNASGGEGSDIGAFEVACVTPQLGTFADTAVLLNGTVAVTPTSVPLDPTTLLTVSSDTFTGDLAIQSFPRLTVRISNAKPAGRHTITVKATGNCGATVTKTFTLTVGNTCPANTGTAVQVASDLTTTFSEITACGETTAIPRTASTVGTLPADYALDGLNLAYDITTTAKYTGPIVVTFKVPSTVTAEQFARLRVLHGENGQLVDRTILAPNSPMPNFATRELSARVDSLSPFVVALAPLPQPPIVAGSVLVFPLYTSEVNNAAVNTRLNFTNSDPTRLAYVHVFFISNQDCTVADTILCLTPNQTASFLASDFDPGTTGYVVAVAVNEQGCPINFNNLIGSEFVKLASGHAANLEAQAIAALPTGVFACNPADSAATLKFDGVQYSMLPHTLAVNNLPSPLDGNDTLLILDRIGGDLNGGEAARLSNLAGLLYNDREIGYSFVQGTSQCQLIGRLNTGFPRTSPPLNQIIPKGRTGWLRFNQSDNGAMIGVMMNLNPKGFNQGHYLHVLRYTATTLTIPVYSPVCAVIS